MHLSQNSSFRSVKVEKKSSKEVIVLYQLFPRNRWHVTASSSTGQGNGYLHPISGYPTSARGDVIQAFLIVACWYVVNGLCGTSTGLFGRRIRIIRALQIHVSDTTTASAEDVCHAFHDAGLAAPWKISGQFQHFPFAC